MTYRVRVTPEAESDLARLFDFVLERELQRATGDPSLAERAIGAIEAGFATLATSPFTCRKVGGSPFLRELIIPFGASGYVALFEIVSSSEVLVAAVRHQREADYR
ncbi:MAG: type II toxin-antitoxin system RelE/ParE family toxin [Rhodocyclaceae bacterium]|nr:type II toxin-antitoxin system RelE/ParE family toxin [Rhodocyclaceae bacterium]